MSRVVLVTGGSKGIGAAVCRAFAVEGDTVIINYNSSQADADALREELSGSAREVSVEKADVSDLAGTKQMVENIISRHDRIDVLVNNAGITRDGYLMLMSEKDWHDVININLTGMFTCSKAVSGQMISQRSGAIINMSSLSGFNPMPGQTNYAAAKGGVIAFTSALARELAPFGIRVNAVAPGVIETDMVRSLAQEAKNRFLENIPMKRFGLAEEVASVVKFLASEDAGYITGETIKISGGLQ